jgi:pimeloyl-ACP methyl ester carboxylesterase
MNQHRRAGVVTGMVCCICFNSLLAQETVIGRWDGVISIMGNNLGISVIFEMAAEGLAARIDIPQQGAQGLSLVNVRYDDPTVHFELPAPQGTAVLEGDKTDDSIAGSFTQAGLAGTFTIERSGAPIEEPADEERPPPYGEEEVTFSNGEVTLAGTLTIPRSEAPFPAVIMITGSGPQNRDEELFGFKPFRMIADHFTRHGIAVLRYDDRGVGGSTGNVAESTSEDFAADVLEAVVYLQTRDEIDVGRIGLVGHSEGGIVAPMAATRSDGVAFIVLMAGTAVTGEEILFAQGEAILKANGATDVQLQTQRETQRRMFEVVRTGEGMEELEADVRAQVREGIDSLSPDERAAITDVDAVVDAQVNGQLDAIRSRWFQFFLDYDPNTDLEQVDVPVLALFGELDLQVPPEVNRGPMEQALERSGNPDVTFHTFPKANHLFLTAETGSPNEYPAMEKVFVPGFMEMMTGWILERVGGE